MQEVSRHFKKIVAGASRGTSHTIPNKERDVEMLRGMYLASNLYEKVLGGREFKVAYDNPKDIQDQGWKDLHLGNGIKKWWRSKRATVERSTEQIFKGRLKLAQMETEELRWSRHSELDELPGGILEEEQNFQETELDFDGLEIAKASVQEEYSNNLDDQEY